MECYRADVEGNRGRGRPRRRGTDGMRGCSNDRGLTKPEAKECVKNKNEWKRIIGGRRR